MPITAYAPFASTTTLAPSASVTAKRQPKASSALPDWMPLSAPSSCRHTGPASAWASGIKVTVSSPGAGALRREAPARAADREPGVEGAMRRVMERMGTRPAAVPAAKTSSKSGSSVYLICARQRLRRE